MEITEEQITEKLPEFREAVEEKHKADFAEDSDKYDRRDIERFREDDAYAKCFIRSFWAEKVGLKDAVDQVEIVFTFRKKHGLNDLTEDSFPEDFANREFLYWKGVNNQGQRILHFKVVKHKKEQSDLVEKYIAYFLDQHQKEIPGQRMVLIFDFKGAGVTNMDMDKVKYIISCFSKYFPSLLAYILLYEMPWILNTFWKIIQTWLSSEQRKKIILVKKKDISKYINEDQLEEHMKDMKDTKDTKDTKSS